MDSGPSVTLTNADKVLYPATGTTKADVFAYYTGIAEVMVPHTAGRPATRKRWPNGVGQESFFEKKLASSAPKWLPRATMQHRSGLTTYPIIDSVDALAWIAQQAALEVHVPQWRFVPAGNGGKLKPGPATRLVFDLDPGEGVQMSQLAEVARAIRDLVADIGLTTLPVTSGSKGLHLYTPLDKLVSSQGAVVLAKQIARQLQNSMPDLVTAVMKKSLRTGKVFVDWSQNNSSKTTVAPYSLRGREHPTVAAPRTWEELDDPEIRHLRYDEVLARVARDGDLLAALDSPAPVPDRLAGYRSRRDAAKTPEPVPGNPAGRSVAVPQNTFVIQEHHARRLHYDFRLEHDGVLVSWAVPKNLPVSPSVNHLAVRTEDHPLEYGTFQGTIPKGQYGAGAVTVWDSGTYEAEKFRDDEVLVTLHGERISGRYALIRTGGDQWLAHRTKDQPVFPSREFQELYPMLPTHGSVSKMTPAKWAFEGKWDGYRLLVDAEHGAVRLRSRSGRNVTAEHPRLRSVAADLAEHHAVLDGEVVALDEAGVPRFADMQNSARSNRVEFWAFDLLYLDGRSLLRASYRDRRKLLETLAGGTNLVVPELIPGDGSEALELSRTHGWEGVVAKKWDSTYQPGRRSESWIKQKHWKTQEVVIGGWRAGEGGRSSSIGSLLMGIPAGRALRFAGRVGTGFTESDLTRLKTTLAPLRTDDSPFDAPLSGHDAERVTFVRPTLVGEVRYREWTADGRLRQPSWRGLRPEKTAGDVVREE
ncbi:MAG TPA: ATP-dependent DNA ligase [Mycobacterium sp.]